jgi:hypothetical protein
MKRLRGTGTRINAMNRDRSPPRPNSQHAGSGRPPGQLHEAPTLPQVNSANYAGQKVKRK